jgi:hypothetical protein
VTLALEDHDAFGSVHDNGTVGSARGKRLVAELPLADGQDLLLVLIAAHGKSSILAAFEPASLVCIA